MMSPACLLSKVAIGGRGRPVELRKTNFQAHSHRVLCYLSNIIVLLSIIVLSLAAL